MRVIRGIDRDGNPTARSHFVLPVARSTGLTTNGKLGVSAVANRSGATTDHPGGKCVDGFVMGFAETRFGIGH
ncbi:MAG: hypothetical protein AAF693_13720 [Bacteroidota bacterium]